MVTPSILELSSIISENTKILNDYLTSHNLPTPSFDEDSPLGLPLPPHIVACQDIIHNAASDLKALMQGPVRRVQNASDVSPYSHPHLLLLKLISASIVNDSPCNLPLQHRLNLSRRKHNNIFRNRIKMQSHRVRYSTNPTICNDGPHLHRI